MSLACIAIGLAPAFKMRFWNVGAEGRARRRHCHRVLDDQLRRQDEHRDAFLCMSHQRHRRGRHLGPHPRLLQGQVEHERNAVHADDELHRHSAHVVRRLQKWRTLRDRTPSAPSLPKATSSTSAGSAICSPTAITRTSWTVIIVLVLAALVYPLSEVHQARL